MAVAEIAAVASSVVAALSVAVAICASRKADRSNEIAVRANEIAEETSQRIEITQAPDLVAVSMSTNETNTVVEVINKGQTRALDAFLQWETPAANAHYSFTPWPAQVVAPGETVRFDCTAGREAVLSGLVIMSTAVLISWRMPTGQACERRCSLNPTIEEPRREREEPAGAR